MATNIARQTEIVCARLDDIQSNWERIKDEKPVSKSSYRFIRAGSQAIQKIKDFFSRVKEWGKSGTWNINAQAAAKIGREFKEVTQLISIFAKQSEKGSLAPDADLKSLEQVLTKIKGLVENSVLQPKVTHGLNRHVNAALEAIKMQESANTLAEQIRSMEVPQQPPQQQQPIREQERPAPAPAAAPAATPAPAAAAPAPVVSQERLFPDSYRHDMNRNKEVVDALLQLNERRGIALCTQVFESLVSNPNRPPNAQDYKTAMMLADAIISAPNGKKLAHLHNIAYEFGYMRYADSLVNQVLDMQDIGPAFQQNMILQLSTAFGIYLEAGRHEKIDVVMEQLTERGLKNIGDIALEDAQRAMPPPMDVE